MSIVTNGVAVAWFVCLSVCLSVTIVSPAKTAEPIEMPFGFWTRMGPRKHVLGYILPWIHLSPNPNGLFDRFRRFFHSSRQRIATLYNNPLLVLRKIAPFHRGTGPASNTCFFRPTRVRDPNGISIGSAVFAGVTNMAENGGRKQCVPWRLNRNFH